MCFLLPAAIVATTAALATASAKASARPADCNNEDLDSWLYDDPRWVPPGYHVICIDDESSSAKINSKKNNKIRSVDGEGRRIRMWVGGHSQNSPVKWLLNSTSDIHEFRKQVEKRSKMKRQKRWRILPWSLHKAEDGRSMLREKDLSGILLAFEGGRWIWPGIREGYERSLPLEGAGNVTLRTLTLDPLAFTLEGFVSSDESAKIRKAAKPKFKAAQVATTDSRKEDQLIQARAASQAWVSPGEDKSFEAVARRAAHLTRVPKRLQVDFRVIRYKKEQRFVAHTDYYDKNDFKEDPKMMKELKHGRNWLVTLYAYLSNVTAGGETYFPMTYGKPFPSKLDSCDGPAVTPKEGRVLMFYSLHPNGKPNLSSLHGGCKVRKGVKYTVNIWTFHQDLHEKEIREKEEAAIFHTDRQEL
eukprot:TRINITY_DN1845_c3_g1_i1.p1 TRINITY_DN1845_c3_g1~~TRINITY_DN1845_c3_g1_i1.p1  ORF type:complete len:416 (+),score=82.92 TRINITY_DN1845_c3_g1_i1:40-1287(+)